MRLVSTTQWCFVIFLVLFDKVFFVPFVASEDKNVSIFESCTLNLMYQSDFSFNGKINDGEFLILLDSLAPPTCDIVHAYKNDFLLKKLWETVTCVCPNDDPRVAVLSIISNDGDSEELHFLQTQDDVVDFEAAPKLECCNNQLEVPFGLDIDSPELQKYNRICSAIDIAVYRECVRINPSLGYTALLPEASKMQDPTNNPTQASTQAPTQVPGKNLAQTPIKNTKLSSPLPSTVSPTPLPIPPTTTPSTSRPTISPTTPPTTSPTTPPTTTPTTTPPTTTPTTTPTTPVQTKSPTQAPTEFPTLALNIDPESVKYEDSLSNTSTSQQSDEKNIFDRTGEEDLLSSSSISSSPVVNDDTSTNSNIYRIMFYLASFITIVNSGCYLLYRKRIKGALGKEENEEKKKLDLSENEDPTNHTENDFNDSYGDCPQAVDESNADESFDWGGFGLEDDVKEAKEDVEELPNDNASESQRNESTSDSNKNYDLTEFQAMKKKYELSSELFNNTLGSKKKKEEGDVDQQQDQQQKKKSLKTETISKKIGSINRKLIDQCWNGSQNLSEDSEDDWDGANFSDDDSCYDPETPKKKSPQGKTDAELKDKETIRRKVNMKKTLSARPSWGKVSESTRHLVINANGRGDAMKMVNNGIEAGPSRLRESLRQNTAARRSVGSSSVDDDDADDGSHYSLRRTSGRSSNSDDGADFSDDDSYYDPLNKTKIRSTPPRAGAPPSPSMQQIDFNRLRMERQASHRHMQIKRPNPQRGLQQIQLPPSRRQIQMEGQIRHGRLQVERQPSRGILPMERQPSRRNMQMERQPSWRNMQMERQPSWRNMQTDNQPTHRPSYTLTDIETGHIPNPGYSRQRSTEESNRDRRSKKTQKRKKRFAHK